ncbi:MAG: hypothetical protein GTO41_11930 [Burkholderiales bacterium]|nr:hypothetical protein [Burkholderiales bacterium]
MNVTIGFLFLTVAVWLFGGALIASRFPQGPKWLTGPVASQAVMLGSMFCAALGLGLVGEFSVKDGIGSLSPWQTLLSGVSGLLLVGSWYGIRKTLRRLPRPAEFIASGMLDARTLKGSRVIPFLDRDAAAANNGSGVPPSKRPRKKRAA